MVRKKPAKFSFASYFSAAEIYSKLKPERAAHQRSAVSRSYYAVLHGCLFGAISAPVESGTCRQASMDVANTIAGQWYLKESDTGYSSAPGLAISMLLDNSVLLDVTGNKIRDVSGVDPVTVTSSACYRDQDYKDKYAYVTLLSSASLGISYGSGTCPSTLPSDYKLYVR